MSEISISTVGISDTIIKALIFLVLMFSTLFFCTKILSYYSEKISLEEDLYSFVTSGRGLYFDDTFMPIKKENAKYALMIRDMFRDNNND